MELADSLTLAEFMATGSTPPNRRQVTTPNNHRPLGKRRTCHCGTCLSCLDNAKWERIFHDKFEDPTYYSRSYPGPGSSLRQW
jgi:hypothetical protein